MSASTMNRRTFALMLGVGSLLTAGGCIGRRRRKRRRKRRRQAAQPHDARPNDAALARADQAPPEL